MGIEKGCPEHGIEHLVRTVTINIVEEVEGLEADDFGAVMVSDFGETKEKRHFEGRDKVNRMYCTECGWEKDLMESTRGDN